MNDLDRCIAALESMHTDDDTAALTQSTVEEQIIEETYGQLLRQAQDLDTIDRLRLFNELVLDAQVAKALAVNDARSEGYSWTQIGDALGVTRSAAQQRYGH